MAIVTRVVSYRWADGAESSARSLALPSYGPGIETPLHAPGRERNRRGTSSGRAFTKQWRDRGEKAIARDVRMGKEQMTMRAFSEAFPGEPCRE
jgi:hypothetical protein